MFERQDRMRRPGPRQSPSPRDRSRTSDPRGPSPSEPGRGRNASPGTDSVEYETDRVDRRRWPVPWRRAVPLAGDRAAIDAKSVRRGLHRAFQNRGGAGSSSGMREGNVGMNPLQAMLRERQRLEKRRCHRHRMDGGANVVRETGQGQRRRAHAAAHRLGSLDEQYLVAVSCHSMAAARPLGPEPTTMASG